MEKIDIGESETLIFSDLEKLEEITGNSKKIILYQPPTKEYIKSLPFHGSENVWNLGVPDGENCKTPEAFISVSEALLDLEFSRSDFIIALGGGSLSDLAGFVSSVYKRGVNCVIVPTTLLSMVDASIGGKNGINLRGIKNVIGTFRQPNAIFIHPPFLYSLPSIQFHSGLAEIVKYAVSKDASLYSLLIERGVEITQRDSTILDIIIRKCINLKLDVVKRDEKETLGQREILNFGHTIGHAIEMKLGIPHGLAVARGMVSEARITEFLGLTAYGTSDLIEVILSHLVPEYSGIEIERSILSKVYNDKKSRGNMINIPVLKEIGKTEVMEIELVKYREAFYETQVRSGGKQN
ncbi:MAG: 3-dehydroquinate synthase [Candidatus Thermoplasmatota archaeon]|nr:3-dehydroquinate synthase [Candidatus Thermoplasmatota archaeon]